MKIKQVSFDEIYPVWRDKLWKGRVSKIEESNPIDYLGNYNSELLKNKAICLAGFIDEEIVGVNTLLPTSKTHCRSRGFYVDTEQRFKGYGRKLMDETLSHAKKLKFEYIWSLSRKSSLQFYLKFGFKQTSNFIEEYEFGPNCFILKKLERINE